jgi:4-hydroxybenzoate polyprenyltransferase
MANRWWIYQRERFPLHQHGPLIAAFSFGAVAYSSMLRGHWEVPPAGSLIVAFGTCLIFFLQLRIADEFKDYEIDATYRPYRPVPRGLVRLRELAVVFVLGGALQLGLALWLEPMLVLRLVWAWLYLAAMCKEFFARPFLLARPILYMVTHMAIMPIVDLYATSTDWLVAGDHPSAELAWFLAASFFNGIVIETGRKIRSPADEERGVETYSALWGRPRAVAMWWTTVALTLFCATMAGRAIGYGLFITLTLLTIMTLMLAAGGWFLAVPAQGRGKVIEQLSGLWTLTLYIALGVAPLIWGISHG